MGRKIIENPNSCALVHAMNIIGGKWKIIILYQLAEGNLRFGRLFTLLPQISKKVFTDQLKDLEQDGLIVRTKYAEIPPRVEYELSEKGKRLLPILKSLNLWVKESYPEMRFKQCEIE